VGKYTSPFLGSIPLHALTIKKSNYMNLTEFYLAMCNKHVIVNYYSNNRYFVNAVGVDFVLIEKENEKGAIIKLKFGDLYLYELDVPMDTKPIDQDLQIFMCTALDKGTFLQCWDDEVEHREIELVYPSENDMYAIVLESLFGDGSLEDNVRFYISKYLDELGF